MFLRSLVKLNSLILFQSRILPPNSGEDQKQGLCCILDLSQFRISNFLLPSVYYLPENRGSQTYFAPFSVTPKGALPPACFFFSKSGFGHLTNLPDIFSVI